MDSAARRVIVVGGGLAGMSAGVALESAGWDVTLVEARRGLGGRAGSFEDPQTGELLDNCQHVLLGCCTNLLDFYTRIGARDRIQFHRAIHFRDEFGRRFDLSGVRRLPAPLHLGPAMAGFNLLSMHERFLFTQAMLMMMRMGKHGREALEGMPFGEWLDEHEQPETLVTKLYDPIIISGLNEDTRAASAAYAIQIFQNALLSNSAGYLFGMPTCALGKLYEKTPIRDVRLGMRAAGLRFEGMKVTGVELTGGEVLPADAVVLATNFHAVSKWIPEDLRARDGRFEHLEKLETVPILGAHLWFDRPVLMESHAAFVTGPLQWVFRKDAEGKALHGVISAARQWVDRGREEMAGLFEAQIRQLLPAAREAKLVRSQIVVEKRATFSPLPGMDAYRPTQSPGEGGIANLYLAGDYTRTVWPATMEGAVRSGYLAAEGITRLKFLTPDLPMQWPGRWMERPPVVEEKANDYEMSFEELVTHKLRNKKRI